MQKILKKILHEKNIGQINLVSFTVIIILFTIIVNRYFIIGDYYNISENRDNIKKNIYQSIKIGLVGSVDESIKRIEAKRKEALIRLNKENEDRINEAHRLVSEFYEENKGKLSKRKIIENINLILSSIIWNEGDGYYYILSTDGIMLAHPVAKELVGQDVSDLKDIKNTDLIKNILTLIEEQGEGSVSYYWEKPNSLLNQYLKKTYVKEFEPLNIIICSGQYIEDIENKIKREIVEDFNKYSSDTTNYSTIRSFLFEYVDNEIGNDKLKVLAHPDKILKNKLLDETFQDEKKRYFVSSILNTLKKDGKGFLQIKDESGETYNDALSFMVYYPDWHWVILKSYKVNKISELVDEQNELLYSIKPKIRNLLIIFIVFISITLTLSYLISKGIKRIFEDYKHRVSEKNRKLRNVVEEKMKIAQNLKDSEEKYRFIFELSGSTTLMLNKDMTIILANNEGENLFSCKKEELEGKKRWLDFIHKDDYDGIVKKLLDFEKSGKDENIKLEFRINDKKDKIKYVLMTIGKISSSDNIIASMLNISERKKTEDLINKEREKAESNYQFVRSIINSLSYPFYVVNVENYEVEFTNYFGIKDKAKCYEINYNRKIPCKGKNMGCPMNEVVSHKRPITIEHTYRDKNGNWRTFEVNGYPLFDVHGKVNRYIEYRIDITKRKEYEEELKRQKEFFETFMENIPIPVYHKDKNGYFNGLNNEFEAFFGIEKNELLRKKTTEVFKDENASALVQNDKDLYKNRGYQTFEAKVKHFDGSVRDVIFNKTLFTDSTGKVQGLVGVMLDITERKKAEEKVKASYTKLSLAQDEIIKLERKNAVLAMNVTANHELNQPLTGIFGNIDLLKLSLRQTNLSEKQKKYFRNIKTQLNRMKDLINKYESFDTIDYDSYSGNIGMLKFKPVEELPNKQ